MTVCVAALCDGGQGVVLAADHMITAHFPIGYEFEDDRFSKVHRISANAYAMFAGDVVSGDAIVEMARNAVRDNGMSNVGEIAALVSSVYGQYRHMQAAQLCLSPRGLTLERYYELHPVLNPGIVGSIDEALMTHNIGVECIVVGRTKDTYSIHAVHHPGMSSCVDAIGYTAVGSGAPYILLSLLGDKYHKSLPSDKVHKMVQCAKKKSEVAPGVGTESKYLRFPKQEEEV